jgi:hypothetical protein
MAEIIAFTLLAALLLSAARFAADRSIEKALKGLSFVK